MKTNPKKKTFTFGTCGIARILPDPGKLTAETRAVNIRIPFEEALKLHLALHECLSDLNSYNRSTKAAKHMAAVLTVYLHDRRMAVNKGTI